MMHNGLNRILSFIARWFVGLVFVFSGFVKAVDPLGSAYKFQDYFQVLHLEFFNSFAVFLAIVLAALEFAIGLNLILRILEKSNKRLLLVFVSFFTLLTLWIAIKNPVSDCGCFGDALIMSNWQTFFKNVILLILSLFLVSYKNIPRKKLGIGQQRMHAALIFLFSAVVSAYCIIKLPIIDFRPYKVGTNIPEMMKVPEGAASDEYKTLFYYSKNGETQEFDESNYPWQDSTWTFVEMKSELISQGYVPPIHGFSLNHPQKGDLTQAILNNTDYSYLIVAHRLELDKLEVIKDKINEVQQLCIETGRSVYLLTSTSDASIEQLNQGLDIPLEVLNADEITLKTIVRSNPGLVILKEGHIIAKFSSGNIPELSKLKDPLQFAIQQGEGFKNQINLITLGLILGGLIFLLSKSKKEINN